VAGARACPPEERGGPVTVVQGTGVTHLRYQIKK
jgi:hypothetical protein